MYVVCVLVTLSGVATTRIVSNVHVMMSKDISRRFREELARHEIASESEAARRAGVAQPWLSRRLTGDTDWTVADLERICDALGLSFRYVATGDNDTHRPVSADDVMAAIADYVERRITGDISPHPQIAAAAAPRKTATKPPPPPGNSGSER